MVLDVISVQVVKHLVQQLHIHRVVVPDLHKRLQELELVLVKICKCVIFKMRVYCQHVKLVQVQPVVELVALVHHNAVNAHVLLVGHNSRRLAIDEVSALLNVAVVNLLYSGLVVHLHIVAHFPDKILK